ncbi:Uncharacterised protein [Raoultella planticola]|uniref:Uncharacterized protein n=1 Tax=Raoultella planticola TaxID=575 RepID=A0A485AQT3_RAOPL|nr:Uncharacterised protein [Raoultella planticola]
MLSMVAFVYTTWVIAREQQVFFDRLIAIFRAAGFGGEDTEDTVGVTNGGDFRVGGDDGFVGKIERHQRTGFNACRRVADHKIEVHLFQFFENFIYTFAGQRIFITRLGGGRI